MAWQSAPSDGTTLNNALFSPLYDGFPNAAGDRNGKGFNLTNNADVWIKRLLDTYSGNDLVVFSAGFHFRTLAQGVAAGDGDVAVSIAGGNLAVGSNTITIAPVPRGVNGANTNYKVYVSNGTGTAEACPVTGGTAVAGASTGTLTITCANAHTGAWTARSATTGIMEAVWHLPTNGGTILVEAGTITVFDSIRITRSFVRLVGSGNSSTIITSSIVAPIIFLDGASGGAANEIRDLQVRGTSADIGAQGIRCSTQTFSRIENVVVGYISYGLKVVGDCFFNRVRDLSAITCYQDGITVATGGAGSGTFDNCIIGGDDIGVNGINIITCVGATFVNCYVQKCYNGIILSPSASGVIAYVDFYNVLTDSSNGQGLVINSNSGTTVKQIRLFGCSTGNGQAIGSPLVPANGVLIQGAGTIDGIVFEGHQSSFNMGQGMSIGSGTNIFLNNCHICGNGLISSNTLPGLGISGASTSRIKITGGVYGQAFGYSNSQNYGIVLNTGVDRVEVLGATLTPNVTGPIAIGTVTNCRVEGNIGYNPVGPAAITVPATTVAYTNGPTPAMFYARGGTVTDIKLGSTTVGTVTPWAGRVPANGTITFTYSSVPTVVRDVE